MQNSSSKQSVTNSHYTCSEDNFWIGLSSPNYPTLPYVWEDGSSLEWTNWGQYDPNEDGPAAVRIAIMPQPNYMYHYHWADTEPPNQYPFICQHEKGNFVDVVFRCNIANVVYAILPM